MPTLFTRIIQREIPGRFVYEDEQCVAFLSIHPLAHGHTLVVCREEVVEWIDLAPELADHLFRVARRIGQAQKELFKPLRVGLLIQGLEVPHVHLHVVPVNGGQDLEFSRQNTAPDPTELDRAAEQLRSFLNSNA